MPTSTTKSKTSTKKVAGSTSLLAQEIRELINFIAESGLNEVDIETENIKIHVKRSPDQGILNPVGSTHTSITQPQLPPAPSPTATPTTPAAASVETKHTNIKSPMIGTFYEASSPEDQPFVSVGDHVTKGQVVCIIEAMKLFNEIESEVSGTIVKLLVENASPVEYDQPLFEVNPD